MFVNLEYYRTFYYVATQQNMTRAAELMQLTPPTVTKTIQTLEKQLGCTLFIRTSKGVTLTPEGQMLLDNVSKGLLFFQKGEEAINSSGKLLGGEIHIGINESPSFSPTLLKTTRIFCKEHSLVKLVFEQISVPSVYERINKGTINFAFMGIPSGESMPGFSFLELDITDNIPVISSQFKDKFAGKTTIKELSREPLVFCSPNFSIYKHYKKLYEENGAIFAPSVEVPTLSLQIHMVKQGLAYSFIPRTMVQTELESGELIQIDLVEEPTFRRGISLVTGNDIPLNPASKEFIRIFLEQAGTD